MARKLPGDGVTALLFSVQRMSSLFVEFLLQPKAFCICLDRSNRSHKITDLCFAIKIPELLCGN